MSKNIILQDLISRGNYRISLPCIIGRSNEANLILSDYSISHKHALIKDYDNQIWIEDLGSRNGVLVNESRIEGKSLLKSGDSILLGQTRLLVLKIGENLSEETIITHTLTPETEWDLDYKRLKFIYEITAELSGNTGLTTFGEKVFSKFKEVFCQDRSYLALFQEDGSLSPVLMDPPADSAPISSGIVSRLFQNCESLLLEDALSDDSLKERESIMALKIRSALCVPLIYHNEIYGLIYLDRNIPGFYKEDDLKFLRSIAAILGPLIENSRLWSELKHHYNDAMKTLRDTEARLIDMERKAAYVHLAQAMAHEIRNPLVIIGGLVRRIAHSESGSPNREKFQAVISSVERVEAVLKEVDDFIRIPQPEVKLERIDRLVEGEIESHKPEWQGKGCTPTLSVNTSRIMIPLDSGLFKKALSMIFKEISFTIPQGASIKIVILDHNNDLEIIIGDIIKERRFCELYDPELQGKPWSLGLFLNIAHKIISDHGGRILLDPLAEAAFPIIIRMPRTHLNK